MLLLSLLACTDGVLGGFGATTDGVFVAFRDGSGNTGAYAQARAVDPGCVDGFHPDEGEADEPPVEALCGILEEILAETPSRIQASNSVFRTWSAWFDPADDELLGRAATSVDQSACTGAEVPSGEFESVDTTATLDSVGEDVTLAFEGDFEGTVRLHHCDDVVPR